MARRALEARKRRTGRSLRVTEQNVVGKEVYSEEEDDLPMQYRRLTAHLQIGSKNFNRRLSAYLTNHVVMRSALDQAVANSYTKQYPDAPQSTYNSKGDHLPTPSFQSRVAGQDDALLSASEFPFPRQSVDRWRRNIDRLDLENVDLPYW